MDPTEESRPFPRLVLWTEAAPRRFYAALAGVALLFRLAYLIAIAKTPFYFPDRLDPLFYFNWGREIASGSWIGDAIFVQSPLYAYLLAVFLTVFGERILPILLFQVLCGAGTVVLTAWLARRLLGTREAIAAGLLAALYGPFLFYEGMVMKTFLSTFLTVLLVVLLVLSGGIRVRLLALAGLVFALTSLVRDNFVLLYPLLAAGILLAFPAATRKARWRAVALFTAGAAAGILPVTIRNYAVGREFALLTTGGGEVFYIGNNPIANGRYLPPAFVHATPEREHDDFIAKASELSGRPLTGGQSSNYWLREGLRWIGSNPGKWILLLGRKLIIFWNAYELPDNYNYKVVRLVLLSPPSLAGALLYAPLHFVTFGLIAPLGLTGIYLTRRKWRDLLLVHLVLFGYMGTVLLFFNFSRFRVPIVPFLCLFGGAAIAALADEIARWVAVLRTRPRGGPIPEEPGSGAEDAAAQPISDGGSDSGAGADTVGPAPVEPAGPVPWDRYRERPAALAPAGLFVAASLVVNFVGTGGVGAWPTLQAQLNLADTQRSQYVQLTARVGRGEAQLNLADTQRSQGRYEEAERQYRLGLQILGDEEMDPASAAALNVDPARLREEVEKERAAQGVNFLTVRAGLHFGLGALWIARGKDLLPQDRGRGEDLIRKGIREVETAVKEVPYPPYLSRMGEAFALLGKLPEAERAYRAGLAIAPEDFALRYDLAGLLYETGRYAEALAELETAKASLPRMSPAQRSDYHFGMGLLRLDGYRERGKALYHLRRALEANPAHREAGRIREILAELEAAGTRPEPEN